MPTLRRTLPGDADTAFRAITDLRGLPAWNSAIARVLELPADLGPGAQWVVEVTAFGQRWPSRSTLRVLDQATRRFEYVSGTDDGNPSFAEWRWRVAQRPDGCEVSVTWTVNPQSFWRRLLLARMRAAQLERVEVPHSLDALEALCGDLAGPASHDGHDVGEGAAHDR